MGANVSRSLWKTLLCFDCLQHLPHVTYELNLMFLVLFNNRVITCLELLICIKYGLDMFKKAEIVSITLWLLFQVRKQSVKVNNCLMFLFYA